MELESSVLTADVYHLDIGGVNGTWVWDFGSFTLIGSEEHPHRHPSNMELFSATVNGVDADDFRDREPDKTVEVEIYEGDYIIYIESSSDNPSHALSPNNEPYTVVENEATADGQDVVVLKENKSHGRTEVIVVEKSTFENDWVTVNQF